MIHYGIRQSVWGVVQSLAKIMLLNMQRQFTMRRNRMNKAEIDTQAEQEGAALKRQGRYAQSRYRWIRLQEEYKRAVEQKAFRR